ncbi:DUF3089 domain-containing protein [Brachyspira pilosicoli]|uniref:DUF3089 domain-containing protein n=1 Tax=Brachyspira pilosicoli TaxID=52584 RepID=UPI00242BF06C|nr:DUF3089 domain-containing protein [Brachyspira pilosicoli]
MKKLLLLLLLSILLYSCKETNIDYSDKNNWLQISEDKNNEVDVFYLYPTVWYGEGTNKDFVCPIDFKPMRENATNALISQSSVFEEVGNIYAPFYRQADALYILDTNNNIKNKEKYFNDIPKKDALAAFDYFIKNYNNNKPFILIGHSQGAMMIKEILIDYFKTNENLMNRLVAAYIIGYSVTTNDLEKNPHLKFARSEYDTGVIISYNTESSIFNGYNPTLLEGAIAINPITWTLEEDKAAKEESLGSCFFAGTNYNIVKNFASAKVDKKRGVIKCDSINADDFYIDGMFEKGNYHVYDIALYYNDLKENARKRVGAFWK